MKPSDLAPNATVIVNVYGAGPGFVHYRVSAHGKAQLTVQEQILVLRGAADYLQRHLDVVTDDNG